MGNQPAVKTTKPGKSPKAHLGGSKNGQTGKIEERIDMRLSARPKLDALGIDAICERITDGEFQAEIARSIGIAKSSLTDWIAADTERSARVKEAAAVSAQHWDLQAERVLIEANEDSVGAISKARELASHYRWRAKSRNPREYGDRLNLDAEIKNSDMTDEQVRAQLAVLLKK